MLRLRRAQRQGRGQPNLLRRAARRVVLRFCEIFLMLAFLGRQVLRPRWLCRLLEPFAMLIVGILGVLLFLLRVWDKPSLYD